MCKEKNTAKSNMHNKHSEKGWDKNYSETGVKQTQLYHNQKYRKKKDLYMFIFIHVFLNKKGQNKY